MAPVIICIDGIPGAGKTTLLNRLSHRYPCFPEPISEWKLLPLFYENPAKYAFSFHLEILLSQFKQNLKFPDSGVVLVERCPWTSRHIFAPLLLNENELLLYNQVYQNLKYKVNYFIFLEIEPKLALQRIHKRSISDDKISLEYLEKLNNQYSKNLKMDYANVCLIDANKSTNSVELDTILKIEDYLEKNAFFY